MLSHFYIYVEYLVENPCNVFKVTVLFQSFETCLKQVLLIYLSEVHTVMQNNE